MPQRISSSCQGFSLERESGNRLRISLEIESCTLQNNPGYLDLVYDDFNRFAAHIKACPNFRKPKAR